jgi:hypothetical protein
MLFLSDAHEGAGEEEADARLLRQIKLMNTIRQSDWMGTSVQCVLVENSSSAITAHDVVRSLLTTPKILPNLSDLQLGTLTSELPFFPKSNFLRGLTKVHTGLRVLSLLGNDPAAPGKSNYLYVSPRSFARLASSLPNLQQFGITQVEWICESHFTAFFSNLASNLVELTLNNFDDDVCLTDGVFNTIAVHCHNLESFNLWFCEAPIEVNSFAKIFQSNKNLSRLDLRGSELDDDVLPRVLLEHCPQLETLQIPFCDWATDDFIMRLINSQIRAFGFVPFKKINISRTPITRSGLRAALTRWRDSNGTLADVQYMV